MVFKLFKHHVTNYIQVIFSELFSLTVLPAKWDLAISKLYQIYT